MAASISGRQGRNLDVLVQMKPGMQCEPDNDECEWFTPDTTKHKHPVYYLT